MADRVGRQHALYGRLSMQPMLSTRMACLQSAECLDKTVQTMRYLGRGGSQGQADFCLLTGSTMRLQAFHLLRLRCSSSAWSRAAAGPRMSISVSSGVALAWHCIGLGHACTCQVKMSEGIPVMNRGVGCHQ